MQFEATSLGGTRNHNLRTKPLKIVQDRVQMSNDISLKLTGILLTCMVEIRVRWNVDWTIILVSDVSCIPLMELLIFVFTPKIQRMLNFHLNETLIDHNTYTALEL